jgi:hypothetical protein
LIWLSKKEESLPGFAKNKKFEEEKLMPIE